MALLKETVPEELGWNHLHMLPCYDKNGEYMLDVSLCGASPLLISLSSSSILGPHHRYIFHFQASIPIPIQRLKLGHYLVNVHLVYIPLPMHELVTQVLEF